MVEQLKFIARRNRRIVHVTEDERKVECRYIGTMKEGVLTESWEFSVDGVPKTESEVAALF